MIAQEKRAMIGKPALQRAPEDVIEASMDLSQMTVEMRHHFAQRRLQQPLRPALPPRTSTITWSLPQSSSGSSGTNSSGPIPTSSSDATNASSRGHPSEGTASTYHSAPVSQGHSILIPQRPKRSATQSSTPPQAREKRITRVAVPSALLRGLGDLSQLPAPGSSLVADPFIPLSTLPVDDAAKANALDAGLEQYRWLSGKVSDDTLNDGPRTVDGVEAEDLFSQTTDQKMAAGPTAITVDYFSMSSRRNLTPSRTNSTKKAKTVPGKHSVTSSQSSTSPYKRPSMDLPPLPTAATKKQSRITSSILDSSFRPLSLGLFLKSSSKSSSLNAATMFGNISDSIWSDPTEVTEPPSSSLRRQEPKQSMATSSSKDSTIHSALLTESRRGSDASDTATSVNDAYDGASFTKGEVYEMQEKQIVQIETRRQEAEAVPSPREELPEEARGETVSAAVYRDATSFAPFMTPHHRAVFPDQLEERAGDRSNGAITPDLSQIHSAPLPPATLPAQASASACAPSKGGFASSLRAKARLTLSRARSINTPQQQTTLQARQVAVAEPAKKRSLDVACPRQDSLVVMSRSPAESNASHSTIVETCNVNITSASNSPNPGLGLGLSDANGKMMEPTATSGHSSDFQSNSPILGMSLGNRASSKLSQYSNFSPATRHTFQSTTQEDRLGTPPMRQTPSAQYGVLSTLSPKYGQSPTMIGNDWMLNRQQQQSQRHHSHKPSTASSACDTISSCMTGDDTSMYDGERAQDQRARLLKTIQQRQKGVLDQGSVEQKGFFSHTSRLSIDSGSATPRAGTPLPVGDASVQQRSMSMKNAANLIVETKQATLLESNAPHTAPLTPPWTPSEQSSLLATAATLQDKTPSREEQTAAKLAKLRPLSLAVQQHSATSSSVPRFMNNGSATSSWHRSQYSTASTITAPSASSSIASLYTSPHRLSTIAATSPSRSTFKAPVGYKSSGGGAPVGVLPTLGADASPSFLTSTPRLAASASPRSPGSQTLPTWGEVATPSPSFKRASNTIPHHSPLSSHHAYTTPLRIQR